MISIKTISIGEPDVSPMINTFNFRDETDEIIFYNTINMINEKIANGLKINIYETLFFLCEYILKGIRLGLTITEIRNNAHKILTQENVMIGVPQMTQKIIFEINFGNKHEKQVVLEEAIGNSEYILAEK
ncbi:MAG TPA: urease subunit gamma [Nitrososphaeraceae archaeon]|nr:urease subunit gamma [Nitrososphaeraceae archaeon]